MSKSYPDYYAKSIYDVSCSFFKENGFTNVLVDLDNTLDSFDTLLPSERAISLKKEFEENGLTLYIISNNRGKRVSRYASSLGVVYLSSTMKPFGKRLRKFIKEKGLIEESCILCGDQLLTDVKCGRRAGIKTMLLDPISKHDQWTTRFNRLLDRPLRKRLKKKGILIYLEDKYGKKN